MTQFRIRLLSNSTEQHTTVSQSLSVSVSVSDISGTIFVNLVQTIDLLILIFFEENLKEIYIFLYSMRHERACDKQTWHTVRTHKM